MKKLIATAALAATIGLGAGSISSPEVATAQTGGRNLIEPCIHEDGSGQAKCFWFAKKMGNGKGRSLIIHNLGDKEMVQIISHKKARVLWWRWQLTEGGTQSC